MSTEDGPTTGQASNSNNESIKVTTETATGAGLQTKINLEP